MTALRSYSAHSYVPISHIIHTSSILPLLCIFLFAILLLFSCNHLYSVGARLILPSSVATYSKCSRYRLSQYKEQYCLYNADMLIMLNRVYPN